MGEIIESLTKLSYEISECWLQIYEIDTKGTNTIPLLKRLGDSGMKRSVITTDAYPDGRRGGRQPRAKRSQEDERVVTLGVARPLPGHLPVDIVAVNAVRCAKR